MVQRHLILASGSPYRKQLLEDAGYRVTAVVSGVAEPDLSSFPDLGAGLTYLAHVKARAVQALGYEGLIVGADTMSLVGRDVLGKPSDIEDARRMLLQLSGAAHVVLTGWCLLRTTDGLSWSGVEETSVRMREWTASELEDYLENGEWQGKCGAYGLQLPHDPFVTELKGSASNVIGIPLERLAALFDEFPELSSPAEIVGQ